MKYTTIIEKLKSFINIIANTDKIMYIIPAVILLGVILFTTSKMSDKMKKILYVITYVSVIGAVIYNYNKEILAFMDYLVELIVENILFPNLAVYILVLLVINVIVIKSIISKKTKLYVKNINITMFTLTQLFLCLIVDTILKNNINVYEKLTVYTNQNLLILIELSMQLFVIWLTVLATIKLIDYLITKSENNNKVIEQELVIENKEEIKEFTYEIIEPIPVKKKKVLEIGDF